MNLRLFIVSYLLSLGLLGLIIRLVQQGKLDIAYCWIWLAFGIVSPLIVLKYDWVIWVSELIGAVTPTTTLFLFAIIILFLMCLQFSMVISAQRRQIKKLVQQVALLSKEF